MNLLGAMAVSVGAFIGACLRWGLGVWFSSVQWAFPLATLVANLGGAYMVGLSVGFFSANEHLSAQWRLFIITGFLGGLTTFSTFSLEAMQLIQKGDWQWAMMHSALHLVGSIVFCFAGFYTWRAIFS